MHKRGNLASSSGLFIYMSTPNIHIVFGLDALQNLMFPCWGLVLCYWYFTPPLCDKSLPSAVVCWEYVTYF